MGTLKSAYLHCVGGISGDMVLGAVVDAGVSVEEINRAFAAMNVEGLALSCKVGQRGGVTGTLASVNVDGSGRRPHQIREFISIVEGSALEPKMVERASAVFQRLADAEAAVHRVSEGEAHLHELGDFDTLADVVGSVVGLELLGIGNLYCSPLPSGSGVVHSGHGPLPAPSPAAAALFAMASAPVVPPPGGRADAGEMVTPTGAALATTLATFRQPAMNLERVAYGLGSRESRHYPNVLALWIGEETGAVRVTELSLIETNIDDMSAELLAFAQERLFELGARDVWFSPIQMKKNRPGTMLSALVPTDLEAQAVDLVIRETSTLGVRVRSISRHEADREVVKVGTSFGQVKVKVKWLKGSTVAVSPEYEDCRVIALDRGMPLAEVYRTVESEASEKLLDR